MKNVILELGQLLGCSLRQLHQWGYRGHVPYRWRLPMMKLAAERLVPLAEGDFVWKRWRAREAARNNDESAARGTDSRGKRAAGSAGAGE